MSLLTDFFKPVPSIEGISDADYESLRHYVVTLEASARMIDLSYYIIDYKKREFIYVSGHPRYRANPFVWFYISILPTTFQSFAWVVQRLRLLACVILS